MEKIGIISDKIAVNMQDLKNQYSITRKTEWVCVICNSIINSEYKEQYIKNDFTKRTLQERTDWPNLIDNEKRNTICSLECYNKQKEILNNKYYDEMIFGIPLKYRTIEADKKMVFDNYGVNLFITGKSGVGKTVLAAGIIKHGIRNERLNYQWINYPQFIMELQNMYKKDNESPFDKADEVANFSGLLVIDDLGAEKMTDWVRQISYFLINEREQRCLPVIITSNFSLEQIAEQIDVRISSRIIGICKSVKLNGKDRRIDDNDKKWKQGESKNKSGFNYL